MDVTDSRRADRRESRVPLRRGLVEGVLVLLVLVGLLTVDPSAATGALGLVERDDHPTTVGLHGPVTVTRGPAFGDLWVLDGDVRIRGEVDGDVTVVAGSVRVAGHVTGDVTVVRGTAELLPGGRVDGTIRQDTGLDALPGDLAAVAWGLVLGLALVVVAVLPRPSRRRRPPAAALPIGLVLLTVAVLAGAPLGHPVVLVVGTAAAARLAATAIDPAAPARWRGWLLTAGTVHVLTLVSTSLAIHLLAGAAAWALACALVAGARRLSPEGETTFTPV